MAAKVAGTIANCAYLGLRKSEAFALSMASAELGSHPETISIERQVGRKKDDIKKPKGGRSRFIAVTGLAKEAWNEFGAGDTGGPMYPRSADKSFTATSFDFYFRQLVSASGITGLSMHEFRHFHATWFAYLGLPEWMISIQLGHSLKMASMTSLYTHVDELAIEKIFEATQGEVAPLEPMTPISRSDFVPPRMAGIRSPVEMRSDLE